MLYNLLGPGTSFAPLPGYEPGEDFAVA